MVFKCKIIFRFFSVTIGNIIKVVFGHISKVINGLRPVNLKDYRIKSGNDRDGKWGKSVDNYKCVVQCGRSMTEMLGVLAIIAVLSVGGIAGFAKAIRAHRSNIQKELLVQLFSNALNLRSDLFSLKNSNDQSVTYLFYTLGIIPDGISYESNSLYDKDGNIIGVSYGITSWKDDSENIYSTLEYKIIIKLMHSTSILTPSASDFCQNAITVAQQYVKDIKKIMLFQTDAQSNQINHQDLKKKTLSDIQNFCNLCKSSGYCGLYLYIYP